MCKSAHCQGRFHASSGQVEAFGAEVMRFFRGTIIGATLFGFLVPASGLADEIAMRNENGEPVALDTNEIRGCVIVFDQSGAPFEICRMEAVNLAPESTTRRRPGSQEETGAAEIVYRRVE